MRWVAWFRARFLLKTPHFVFEWDVVDEAEPEVPTQVPESA